jgi:uncharacterized protein with HEPN domain
MPTRDANLRLFDVWHAACRVLEYVEGIDKEALRTSPMRLDAVLRNMEITGEAVRSIPPDVQRLYPSIDWAGARAMPNVLAHGYEAVCFEIVWSTIQRDIPPLEAALREDARRFENEGKWGVE